MKKIIQSILIITSVACNQNRQEYNNTDDIQIEEDVETEESAEISDSLKTNESKEMDELIKKWNWNETISTPEKSKITNFKFSSELLFKSWTWSEGKNKKPAFTIDKISFNPDELKYIYTINHDSLRIFTSYEQPGDGFERGIITKLTEDSLIIKWSTGETDKYMPFKMK